jgi:hypothetical protein
MAPFASVSDFGQTARMFGGRKKRAAEPAEVYQDLRQRALDAVGAGLAAPAPDHPDVAGAVVDIPREGGAFVSVVALADGSTSMYTSVGGGTIGAGEHAPVAAATQQLLRVLQAHLPSFAQDDDGSLPPPGSVRVHLLTPAGSRRGDLPEEAFWGEVPSGLAPVIEAAQEVLTALREADPG